MNGKNGERVLIPIENIEYDKGSDVFRAGIAEVRYQKFHFIAKNNKGHILLQDHRDEVAFKNIKIRTW